MKRLLRCAALNLTALGLILTVITISGCAIHSGGELILNDEGADLNHEQAQLEALAVGSFEYTGVAGVSSIYATGPGGSVTGSSVTRSRYSAPPPYLVRALENTGAFKAVAPLGYPGFHPDLVLEGRVRVDVGEPWWSKAQILVLYAPAWVLPSLSRSWTTIGEFVLYDTNHVRLHKWSFEVEDRYQSWIWWMIRHGGAGDGGFDVQRQNESVIEAVGAAFGGGAD